MIEKLKKNLLIVDDDCSVLETISLFFQEYVENVFFTTSGKHALETLKGIHIDIMITDIAMSSMSGIELACKIRKEQIKIPIIFYTGNGSRELMIECLKYQAYGFVEKPNMKELLDLTQRALLNAEHAGDVELFEEIFTQAMR